jgi:hypothetical protein
MKARPAAVAFTSSLVLFFIPRPSSFILAVCLLVCELLEFLHVTPVRIRFVYRTRVI